MIEKNDELLAEFVSIRGKAAVVSPAAAVDWARKNKRSVLHSKLEWNDKIAGEEYRQGQVRAILRVIVIPSQEQPRVVRAWISNPSDRVVDGGYRPLAESLATGRTALVDEAIGSMRQWRNRYTHLPELDTLFDAIDRAIDKWEASRHKAAG